jgi:hypothetical protein
MEDKEEALKNCKSCRTTLMENVRLFLSASFYHILTFYECSVSKTIADDDAYIFST